ncbi:uncharacterized protein JN550_000142 [Neoarthrinium moseri]|uniref:uncharacterized protein n=1 Tax=Neoarthrinium moseri TaxID=1658444 RepID=UPI001FDDA1AE|nr:uncharacterized protein JN550_000142 [Neoarthrinium moseri]KAI1877960.1 hypothetical protein JN550_000142 [Neoarthrinium moseri]
MHDAASLVSELLQKLSELEHKVELHRQDMATEFRRYSHELLRNVSDDVSAKVEKAITDSMRNYPALTPALDQANPIRHESPSPSPPPLGHTHGHGHGNDGKKQEIGGNNVDTASGRAGRQLQGTRSPPPLLPYNSDTPPDDSPRSPHAREREFQGLFTPSYLPLLDGRDVNLSPLPTALPLRQVESGELTRDSTKAEAEQPASPPPPPVANLRPDPIRRPTEDTLSSVTSDDSTVTKNRRSALRRSSSSSTKTQSPRRVRFEVEGGEVLPTASPPTSPRLSDHPLSPLANPTNLMDSVPDSAPAEGERDNMDLLGTSPPLPKKVTSTDRLKALARSSNEDTSKWTMVGDLQNMDEDEEALIMGGRAKSGPALQPAPNFTSAPVPIRNGQHTEVIKGKDEPIDMGEVEDEDEDEDEDLLEMPALSSFKGKKQFSPPKPTITVHDTSKPAETAPTAGSPGQKSPPEVSSERVDTSHHGIEEDEDFFEYEFDEDGEGGPSMTKALDDKLKALPKYLQETEDDGSDDESTATTPKAQNSQSTLTNLYSASPGIAITRPAPPQAPAPPRATNAAVGSYNGRPFTMSSVKDHSILERAAKMGDVYSFVGSVDGRSGVDESTSYRPDARLFDGTPKSLSERMMMEDLAEARNQSPKDNVSK